MSDSPAEHTSTPSKEKAEILLRAALSKKAFDPVLLRLDRLTSLTDYFLIVSAKSDRQASAIADAVLDEARKHKIRKAAAEGVREGRWVLLDYGDLVVHIFQKQVREFYDLEGLWMEAPRETFAEDIQRDIESASQEAEDDSEWDDVYGEPL
jgi:ribosome-associated protein